MNEFCGIQSMAALKHVKKPKESLQKPTKWNESTMHGWYCSV